MALEHVEEKAKSLRALVGKVKKEMGEKLPISLARDFFDDLHDLETGLDEIVNDLQRVASRLPDFRTPVEIPTVRDPDQPY